MKTKIFTTIICVFCINFSFSQDTLLLLTGKMYSGQITEISNNYIRVRAEGFRINKSKLIYKDELFSYFKNNYNNIIYTPDSINEAAFNTLEMEYFIKGIQAGKKQYHAPFATLGGFTAGVTGGVFGFWGALIPSSYILITGIKTPKAETNFYNTNNIQIPGNNTNLNYGLKYTSTMEVSSTDNQKYSSFYESGYRTSAKDKKIKNSIKGSVLGIITCVAATLIFVHR